MSGRTSPLACHLQSRAMLIHISSRLSCRSFAQARAVKVSIRSLQSFKINKTAFVEYFCLHFHQFWVLWVSRYSPNLVWAMEKFRLIRIFFLDRLGLHWRKIYNATLLACFESHHPSHEYQVLLHRDDGSAVQSLSTIGILALRKMLNDLRS